MPGLWAGDLKAELSQGDLLSPIPFAATTAPERMLKRGATLRHDVQTWQETSVWKPDADGRGYILASGRRVHAIVLSHDCEIDKEKRVLIAPVLSIATVTGDALEAVRNGKRYPFLHLPEIPQKLVESYLDLRGICFVERKVVDNVERLASMSEDGVERLHAQIIGFFTHIPLSDIRVTPK